MFLLRPQHADRCRDQTRALCSAKLDGREWRYVAEGGANVLFRHHPPAAEVGAAKSEFYGKLLRVKKCDAVDDATAKKLRRKRSKSRSLHSSLSRSGSLGGSDSEDVILPAAPYPAHYPHPTKVVEYATKDVLPYLEQQVRGNVYEQVAQLLPVDKRFLVELNEQLLTLDSRPEHRRQSQIDVALQSVMVLPDVTLPPPDEDPLLYFDEAIDSEGSESGASSDKNPAEHDTLLVTGESSTDQTADEELFDALVDDLEDEIKATDAAFPTSGSLSPSSASTVTSGDADVEPDGDEHDVDADDEIDAASMPSAQRRRRRMLSGNCNIFDCCFRNICVEIKPKIGFKPRGKLVADVRKRVCRFCMHQHYKRATGKVEEISEYCPLDLFSRDADRIRRALRALQRTPQNNFKVFVRSKNDDVVDVITGLGTDALPKGVAAQTKHSCRRKRMGFRHSCQSIGTENELHVQQDENDHLLPDVVELLTDVLLNLNILEDLKQIQLLDHIGVDGMWHIQKLIKWVQPFADGDQHLTLRALVDRVRDSLPVDTPQHESEQGSLSRCVAYLEVALDEVPDMGLYDNLSWAAMTLGRLESFYDQLLQRFQVATTLKDCSLLLCLRRAVDGDEAATLPAVPPVHHHPVCPTKSSPSLLLPASLVGSRQTFDHLREYEHRVEFRDMVFNCVVAIVDLDVKSHKSVDDYHRLDDKIVQHYVRTFGDKLQYDTCCE